MDAANARKDAHPDDGGASSGWIISSPSWFPFSMNFITIGGTARIRPTRPARCVSSSAAGEFFVARSISPVMASTPSSTARSAVRVLPDPVPALVWRRPLAINSVSVEAYPPLSSSSV
jgi:hypothetical protein